MATASLVQATWVLFIKCKTEASSLSRFVCTDLRATFAKSEIHQKRTSSTTEPCVIDMVVLAG